MDEFMEWVNSFSDYMEPEDGVLFVIRKPEDMKKVHEKLEEILGERL